ncbi:cytochrome c oxidase polypeptide VIb [Emericellopsis atlantica]|uniref:Cytochrome c oxidase subunit 12, mitochondrial n=1 Tax=Emericellopsis atlantica TaxID=2614577 RepID=A0A9P8CU60_9HYPO|nr:cytochrome c oxidase polypeptide VIb [Emericellopsis atlantica]KAG9257371.1 cytochrome c oxidase polypeptide VIb [Emericellopsis atlantica]
MAEEDGQELVTKPFKFVTGTYNPSVAKFNRLVRNPTLDDGYDSDLSYGINWARWKRRMADANIRIGTDARFPNVNQTKHCWQNYVDYHKCIIAKGEDFAPCRQFWLAYRSLCPSGWYQRWDEQREAGQFPVKLDA